MDRQQAHVIFMGANLAFGVLFLLAPRFSLRLYGLDPDRDKEAALALRYVGGRSLMIGAMLADDDTAEAVFKQLPVVAATDGIGCAASALTGEVPKRTVLLAALTSTIITTIGFQARR